MVGDFINAITNFETITLFIFLAQFLVTTKIKAKKLVATKNFGRDQFFCLNFGRDQKLGEENEKGSDVQFEAKLGSSFLEPGRGAEVRDAGWSTF